MTPTSLAFASSLTPQQRQYVDLLVAEKVAEALSTLVTSSKLIVDSYQALNAQVEALSAQVNAYESKYRDDSKYILTRGKIVNLMKQLGIE